VTLTREGVAADPHLLAGADVRGEAKGGGVALRHGLSVWLLCVERRGRPLISGGR